VDAGGAEQLFGGGTVASVLGAGTLVLTNGTYAAIGAAIGTGLITIGPAATLSATGTISGALDVTSTGIVAISTGSLAFLGATTNTGSITVSRGEIAFDATVTGTGTLSLADGAASAQALSFGGSGGMLDLSQPLTFHGLISSFAAGDAIDLLNTSFTTYSVSNDTLSVLDAGKTVATLDFSGNYTSSSFTLTATGNTTVIGFA
jgi:hypothetical protein